MINATLKLTRTADDGAERYRKYFLVADFAQQRGHGKASIIPMSAGAPMPESDQITVRGGETEAMMAAVSSIKALADNAGFDAEIDFDPS